MNEIRNSISRDPSGLSQAVRPKGVPDPNHYPDRPRVAVGAVIFNNQCVLLVRRGKPPAEGSWAIPGGSLEIGETLQQAVEREILEETGLIVRARDPVFTFDMIERDTAGDVRFHYVIVDLLAEYVAGTVRAGGDAADARWVCSSELAQLKVSRATRDLLRERFRFGA
jgi:ADP-ribose pyrophosphatase